MSYVGRQFDKVVFGNIQLCKKNLTDFSIRFNNSRNIFYQQWSNINPDFNNNRLIFNVTDMDFVRNFNSSQPFQPTVMMTIGTTKYAFILQKTCIIGGRMIWMGTTQGVKDISPDIDNIISVKNVEARFYFTALNSAPIWIAGGRTGLYIYNGSFWKSIYSFPKKWSAQAISYGVFGNKKQALICGTDENLNGYIGTLDAELQFNKVADILDITMFKKITSDNKNGNWILLGSNGNNFSGYFNNNGTIWRRIEGLEGGLSDVATDGKNNWVITSWKTSAKDFNRIYYQKGTVSGNWKMINMGSDYYLNSVGTDGQIWIVGGYGSDGLKFWCSTSNNFDIWNECGKITEFGEMTLFDIIWNGNEWIASGSYLESGKRFGIILKNVIPTSQKWNVFQKIPLENFNESMHHYITLGGSNINKFGVSISIASTPSKSSLYFYNTLAVSTSIDDFINSIRSNTTIPFL